MENKFLEGLSKLEQEMTAQIKNEPNVAEFEPTAKMLQVFAQKIPEREYLFYCETAFIPWLFVHGKK